MRAQGRLAYVLLAWVAFSCASRVEPPSTAEPVSSAAVSEAPSPEVDRMAVDRLIERVASGLRRLTNLQGESNADILAEVRIAQADLASVVEALRREPPEGVPESVIREVAEADDALVSAIDAMVECFQRSSPFDPEPCKAVLEATTERSGTFGGVLARLVPYGNRTRDEVLELLGKRAGSTPTN